MGYSAYTFNPFAFYTMITVFDFLHTYCESRKLPTPTTEDLERCGRMISHHFKRYWSISEFEGLIPDCGFITSIEGGEKIVVTAYPDIFKPEMVKKINSYYHQKSLPEKPFVKPISAPELPIKKRKRIPPKPTKEISVKPTNHLGQIQGQ